jgi:MoaA/NifB/PqqE/SkfB family radical SAM enzyme
MGGTRTKVATIDFHVTSECSQECPYCWGPQQIRALGTRTAMRIIDHIGHFGVRRIVFTGGDPLQRADAARLIRHAKRRGLEVALSTTGDRLTPAFLRRCASAIDLISLPLDGSCEEISALTKKAGHFDAIMQALALVSRYPHLDVKVCTPVTRKNLADIPKIAALVDRWARKVSNRVFYNVFQTFPRAMKVIDWKEWTVSDRQFRALRRRIRGGRARVKINFLSRRTLDQLYVMIFPDGSLVIPSGPAYVAYGPFLEVTDLGAVLARSKFDAAKHWRHARGWQPAWSAAAAAGLIPTG